MNNAQNKATMPRTYYITTMTNDGKFPVYVKFESRRSFWIKLNNGEMYRIAKWMCDGVDNSDELRQIHKMAWKQYHAQR